MKPKTIALLTVAILMSLLLSQCAPAATPAPTSAPVDQPAATEAPAEQAQVTEAPAAAETQAPAAEPQTSGSRVLRVSFSWPNRIDPAVGNDYAGSTSLANLYDTLVFPNAKGGVDPWLAESWEVSEDGLTYTFKLRQGVKFHDGSPLTAGDVVFSYDRLKTIGEGYAYLVTAGVESVEAPDDSTVVFKLSASTGLFLPALVRLYVLNEELVRQNTKSEGPYGENGDFGKEWLQTNDAGSGPYKVKEFPLEQYLLMEKNSDWWGEFAANAPDEVRFIGTTEAVTIRSLMQNKQLEISDQWQSFEAYQALEAIDEVEVAPLLSMTSFYYMINNKKAPTDDVHCRKAIAYAFDYDTAISLEWPGTKAMVGPVPATLAGHDSSLTPYTYDLEKAKAELAQCKYANELDQYPIDVSWVAEVPDEEKYALLFQSNMAEIGLKVNIVKTPWLSLVENMSKQESAPSIATIYVSADLPEAGLMLKQRYHSSTLGTYLQNEWLNDAELDTAIDTSLKTLDDAQRFAQYAEIQKQLLDEAVSLWIYDQVEKHAYRQCVDWPAARNETSLLLGYMFFAANIDVNCQ